MSILESIVAQYAEEAGFLWSLREGAADAPHYDLKDLGKLDERIEAHLDGLRVNGEPAWELARKALEAGGAGAAFTAGVLAFEEGRPEQMQVVLELVAAKPARLAGMVSALGWIPWSKAEMSVRQLAAKSQAAFWRQAGLAAAALQRQDLGGVLEGALSAPELPVRARAIEMVGALGLAAHLSLVRHNLTSADPAVRFASAWTTALLRSDAEAVAILKAFAESKSGHGDQAATLATRRLEPDGCRRWRDKLLIEPHSCRRAVMSTGAFGDPEAVPFLIDMMKSPALARLAGEAFTLITGADLTAANLEGKVPPGFQAGPTDNPADDHVAPDADENLAWPDVPVIAQWWQHHRAAFARGTRYLLGRPIAPDWLQQVLRTGKQRQRQAAALELAILQPGRHLFPTHAPGVRQHKLLGT